MSEVTKTLKLSIFKTPKNITNFNYKFNCFNFYVLRLFLFCICLSNQVLDFSENEIKEIQRILAAILHTGTLI